MGVHVYYGSWCVLTPPLRQPNPATLQKLQADTAALLSQVNASAEALCALCEHHGFDGYLINLETPFTVSKYK